MADDKFAWNESAPVVWVRKRDGRQDPFTLTKLVGGIYAARASLAPLHAAFIARELAQAVLYFLVESQTKPVVEAGDLGETVVKVLRELGDPATAAVFAARAREKHHARRNATAFPPAPSSAEIFSPDILGLHDEGVLQLFQMNRANVWSAVALDVRRLAVFASSAEDLLRRFDAELRRLADGIAAEVGVDALDGALALVAANEESPDWFAGAVLESVRRVCATTGVRCVLNLRPIVPTNLPAVLSAGPLFPFSPDPYWQDWHASFQAHLASRFGASDSAEGNLRMWIHCDTGLTTMQAFPAYAPWLAAAATPGVSFLLDRREIWLADGLAGDGRRWPPLLQTVGVNLPVLWDRLGGARSESELIRRAGPLLESAARAAFQKREHLRRGVSAEIAVCTERPCLTVVPLGLQEAIADVTGCSLGRHEAASRFAAKVFTAFSQRLNREARPYRLAARVLCADDPWAADEGLPKACESAREVFTGAFAAMAPFGSRNVGVRTSVSATPLERFHSLLAAAAQDGIRSVQFRRG